MRYSVIIITFYVNYNSAEPSSPHVAEMDFHTSILSVFIILFFIVIVFFCGQEIIEE